MPRYDQDDKAKMLELAAMGYTHTAIANRFGCSPTYVGEILAEFGRKKVVAKSEEVVSGRKVPKWLESLPTVVDLSHVE